MQHAGFGTVILPGWHDSQLPSGPHGSKPGMTILIIDRDSHPP
jgi:hypothetical protein